MSSKTVYLYDPVTFALVESYEAQESPLEPGEYIIPVDATEMAPPAVVVNEVAVFAPATGTWSIQPDYRGQTIYDQTTGQPQEWELIGAIPAGFALTPPPPTLAQAQATQIAALQAAYQQAVNAPVSFTNAAGTTASFNQDATSIQNLQDVIAAGAAAWAADNLNLWLNTAGQPVTPFTYADLQGLAAAFEAYDVPQYKTLLAQIAAVMAATTVAAVEAITF